MWRLERKSKHCVRVGRLAVEHWAAVDGGMALETSVGLPADATGNPEQLVSALVELFRVRPIGRVALLLESAWLPLMLVDTGTSLLSASQIEKLIRHQMGLVYGDDPEPVAAWTVRTLHRAGDRFAIGHGMSPRVGQAAVDAATQIGVVWDALLPASAWGWQQTCPFRRWSTPNGWWVWQEQDRSLLVRVESKRWVGLHAGAVPGDDGALIGRAIRAERARLGATDSCDPITVEQWQSEAPAPRTDERIDWQAICAPAQRLPQGNGPVVRLSA